MLLALSSWLHPKLGLPRVAAVTAVASESFEGPIASDRLEGLRGALEAVLRGSEEERQMTDVADSAGRIEGLPLWTSRWTALPGYTHTIRIDEPRYVHLFNALLASGGPAHFGQLKLPKGASFGADYMLRPSDAAPKVGVLMEALTADVLPDGSIAIVARVLGRFRIATPTAAAPYACADVALLPDEEELSEARGMQQPTDIPAHWRTEAARAAAAAASLTWWEAEAGLTSAAAAVAEAAAAAAAAEVATVAVAAAAAAAAAAATAAAAAVVVAPVAGTEAAAAAAAAAEEEDGRGTATDTTASILAKGLADEERCGIEVLAPFNLRLSIAGCGFSARSAAERAAEASLATAMAAIEEAEVEAAEVAVEAEESGEAEEADGSMEAEEAKRAPHRRTALDLLFDQGSALEGLRKEAVAPRYKVVYLPRALFSRERPFLLALEHALWSELVLCLRLSRTLQAQQLHTQQQLQAPQQQLQTRSGTPSPAPAVTADERPVSIPEALLLLLPPPPASGWPQGMPNPPAATEWLQRFDYPPVRRAQRLSYLMAAMLPELDRQALLARSSVRERLKVGIFHLCETRMRLRARIALEATLGAAGVTSEGFSP